jgi:hypothetical protein
MAWPGLPCHLRRSCTACTLVRGVAQGVSVRKRVIKILRDLIVCREPSSADEDAAAAAAAAAAASVDVQSPRSPRPIMNAAQRAIDACCRIVTRLGPSEVRPLHPALLA